MRISRPAVAVGAALSGLLVAIPAPAVSKRTDIAGTFIGIAIAER
jgi:hypothetical protein